MKRTSLASALLLALSTTAIADSGADAASLSIFDILDRVVVTATLNERAQRDVASEVSVIDAAEIDRRQVQDIRDLIRYEPGVSVNGSATRFGLNGFSIRGLGGNRVRIETDGVAVPDTFAIGSFSNAGRDLVDVDALKRVEIMRGAGSSLYGSDALGGVVRFVTKDPADFLGKEGGFHSSAKTVYDSANREATLNATLAAGSERHAFSIVATHRSGHATNNQGSVDSGDATRTRPNPQDTDDDAVLAKYVHTAESGREDKFTLDASRGTIRTDVLSSVTAASSTATTRTTGLAADDERQRVRLSFGQVIPLGDDALFDSLDWHVYGQRSETTQDTLEDRRVTAAGVTTQRQRFRRFDFDQTVHGGELLLRKAVDGDRVDHALTLGVDAARTKTEQMRDGFERNLTTGTQTSVVQPDAFPVRDFPITETTTAALFAQDEITLVDGRLTLIPGLRVDHYRLDPKADTIFTTDNPGQVLADITETSWSPKFGAIWRFNDSISAFAQYARGFRAAPYNDVNLGFTNFAFGYKAIPNPDLKPETSHGVEIGLRGSGRLGYFSVSAFENRYRDFIESQAFVGVDPADGLMVFQSINLTRVKIRGAEARAGLDFGAFSDVLQGWTLKASAAHARGDDETAGLPLASIEPDQAVLGIAYDSDRWGAELAGRFVERKERIPAAAAAPFQPAGYSTFDLYGYWKPSEQLSLYGGIANLTDRTYWRWGDVRGLAATSTVVDRFSAAPRSISFGARLTF